MDALTAASARALAGGDPLGALRCIALRDDPAALALRGIAMAQLGEHRRARVLLKRAARGFGSRDVLSRVRCVVAEAEVALAMRDLGPSSGASRTLRAAAAELAARGDRGNAVLARLIVTRRLLGLGRLDEAEASLTDIDPRGLSPALTATAALTRAELALRALRTAEARVALDAAAAWAGRSGIAALVAEVADARSALDKPAARRVSGDAVLPLKLEDVAALLDSGALVVDACRRLVRRGPTSRSLTTRPLLFALLRELAQAWPGDVDRATLIGRVFRIRRPDETHRVRLRVELGRLRRLVDGWVTIVATTRGYALLPQTAADVCVLAPPFDGDRGALLALLSDGTAWPTSALAAALGTSQRTIQRALVDLAREGQVRAIGSARGRRWVAPPFANCTTILLLPTGPTFD